MGPSLRTKEIPYFDFESEQKIHHPDLERLLERMDHCETNDRIERMDQPTAYGMVMEYMGHWLFFGVIVNHISIVHHNLFAS